jgi:murein DD-endopeptidase MepM/ murein hydrolase activator NlpD
MILTACQGITSSSTEEEIPQFQPVTTSLPDIYPYPGKEVTTVIPMIPIEIMSVPFTQTVIRTSENTLTPTEIPVAMCSPLQDETLTSLWEIITNPFGSPPIGREDLHHGVDFAYYRRGERLSIEGEVVQSILPGTVAASIQDRLPYGNMLIIETTQTRLPKVIVDKYNIGSGESLYTLYAHMDQSPLVGLGDAIFCGQELGTVGTTGYDIVNPHLHLETRIGPSEVRFNSMVFYDTSATSEEMENYKWWRTSGDFRNLDPMRVLAEYLSNENAGFQTPTP